MPDAVDEEQSHWRGAYIRRQLFAGAAEGATVLLDGIVKSAGWATW